jgi:hypothetical protein
MYKLDDSKSEQINKHTSFLSSCSTALVPPAFRPELPAAIDPRSLRNDVDGARGAPATALSRRLEARETGGFPYLSSPLVKQGGTKRDGAKSGANAKMRRPMAANTTITVEKALVRLDVEVAIAEGV